MWRGDGGIKEKTIKMTEADIYVVGSFVTNGNYNDKIDKLRNSL